LEGCIIRLPPTVAHMRQVKEKKAPRGRDVIAQGGANRRNPGNTKPQPIKPQRGDIPVLVAMDYFALSGLGQHGDGYPGATLSLCPWLLNVAPLGLNLALILALMDGNRWTHHLPTTTPQVGGLFTDSHRWQG
jgi:hypothetical protein